MVFKDIIKLQEDKTFLTLCSTVIMQIGNVKKELPFKIPSLELFNMDEEYYRKCISMDKTYSVGLDETYESFEAFEDFIIDYLNKISLKIDLENVEDIQKLHSSLRFNQNIYSMKETPKNKKYINESSDLVKRWYANNVKITNISISELMEYSKDIFVLLPKLQSICRTQIYYVKMDDLPKYKLSILSDIGSFSITSDSSLANIKIIRDEDIFKVEVLRMSLNYKFKLKVNEICKINVTSGMGWYIETKEDGYLEVTQN